MLSKKKSIQESTGFLITSLARTMERDFEQHLEELKITRGAYAVLSAIHFDKKTKPAELAVFIGVDGAVVTRHLDRLEKSGFIGRKPDVIDRRSIDINLTPKGQQAVQHGCAGSKATNKKFTAGLTASEIDSLQSMIRKMLANADAPAREI